MTTVKQLIRLLKRYDPDSEIWLADIKTGKPYRDILEFKQTSKYLLIYPDPFVQISTEEIALDSNYIRRSDAL